MIVTSLLTASVVWCLFYGRLPSPALGALCAALGIVLALLGRHAHGGVLTVDQIALKSRFGAVNAGLKTFGCVALILLASLSRSVLAPSVLFLLMSLLTAAGGVRWHDYLRMLSLPASFLLLSGLALLFEWSAAPSGVLNLRFFGGWLTVTAAAQAKAALVLAKALGAVSCLYFLSLSTPMSGIIRALRRAHVPAVVVELMVLIYRYLFLLLEMHGAMRDAAESRLGYSSFSLSVRTTGNLYANLFVRSFQRANACFDAMESRCYSGEIRFLETEKPVTLPQGLAAAALFLLILAAVLSGGVLPL